MAVRDFMKFFKKRGVSCDNHIMKKRHFKEAEMTRMANVIGNVLDAETRIILSENVRNHLEIRTKKHSLEVLGAIAVRKMMKRLKTKPVSWLMHLARIDLEPDKRIKDSGCSKHMMGNQKLFSTYKAYNRGNVIFGSNLRGNIISKGIRKSGLYVMKLRKKPKDKIYLTKIMENFILWHGKLGHVNMRLIQSLASKELFRNLPKLRCLELLYMDLFGPSTVRNYRGNLYTLVIVDNYSSKAYIILNKHTMKIEESLNMTFNETPPSSKRLPLVDDDLDEEEAIKVTERKNLENDIEDETLEVDKVFNIKESNNHPLDNEELRQLEEYMNELDDEFMHLSLMVIEMVEEKIRAQEIKNSKNTKFPDAMEAESSNVFRPCDTTIPPSYSIPLPPPHIYQDDLEDPDVIDMTIKGYDIPKAFHSNGHKTSLSELVEFKCSNYDDFVGPQWANLFQTNEPVYQELVREFFASFEFNEYHSRTNPTCEGISAAIVRREEDWGPFWPTIDNDRFIIRFTVVGSIRDTRVRLAHRFLTTIISGRGSSAHRITSLDIFYLYCIYSIGVVCNIPFRPTRYLKREMIEALSVEPGVGDNSGDEEEDEEVGDHAGEYMDISKRAWLEC
uniref:Uncharacterized protein n=1 Tax=Tanacetum cinerariifolium TaxID=118510 RepID=A0A6L2NJX5_TANCI|nr:hypothetical protein [Tanacetum cinerariifolium]